MRIRKNDRKYSIEEVLSKTDFIHKSKKDAMVDFNGDLIAMNSLRYKTFCESGIKCVECGIKGKYFVKEKDPTSKNYHFNLYAVRGDGKEVLMTKDHIQPKSKGGTNTIKNMQTMCSCCNEKKGNKTEFERLNKNECKQTKK